MSTDVTTPVSDLRDRYLSAVNRLIADGRDDLIPAVTAEYERDVVDVRPRRHLARAC